MSQNPETLALAFILQTRSLGEFLKAGLRPDHFGPPHREAVEFLIQSMKETGGLPTLTQFIRRFPWFQPEPIPEGITTLSVTKEVIEFSLQREVSSRVFGLQAKQFVTSDQLRDVIRDLKDLLAKHETFDLAPADENTQIVRDWYREGEIKQITGIPYPWKELNIETRGIQKHDFILIFGRPKNGKTWVLMSLLAYLLPRMPNDSRILFVSYEMDLQRLMNRLACIIAQVDYGKFNKAQLSQEEYKKYELGLAIIEEAKRKYGRRIFFAGPAIRSSGRKGFSMLDIEQAAETIEPIAIFIDGLLHAKDSRTGKRSRDWSVVSNISSDTKALALARHCPIICTHQANRESEMVPMIETQRDIAYADALAQDADLSIRVTKCRTAEGQRRLLLQPEGAREFELLGFTIGGSFCEDMEIKEVMSEPSAIRALLSRAEDQDPVAAAARGKMKRDKSKVTSASNATTAQVVRESVRRRGGAPGAPDGADVIPIIGGEQSGTG